MIPLTTYQYSEITVEKSPCGPDTAIDGPGPPHKYTGWTNIINTLGLENLSTMDTLASPQDLSIFVANDVSKLSMINEYGEIYFTNFSLILPGRRNFGSGLSPGPATIVQYWFLRCSVVLGVRS